MRKIIVVLSLLFFISCDKKCILYDTSFVTSKYNVFVEPNKLKICPFEIDETISILLEEYEKRGMELDTREKMDEYIKTSYLSVFLFDSMLECDPKYEFGCRGLFYGAVPPYIEIVRVIAVPSQCSLTHELIHFFQFKDNIIDYDHATPETWELTSGDNSIEKSVKTNLDIKWLMGEFN